MSQFLTTLKTEQLGKWHHRLLDDLVLNDEKMGMLIVPRGFITDFASLDRAHNRLLFVAYALVCGYGNCSATMHDWLYSTAQFNRAVSDQLFYRALRAEGVPQWRAGLFWLAVRLGGALRYSSTTSASQSSVSGR